MNNALMPKKFVAVVASLALLTVYDARKSEAAELPQAGKVSIGEKAYRNTCSICHRLGVNGAPRLGDTEDWALRFAQGNEVLYSRAIKGYRGKKGSMPARGSNARLSDEEVKAAVDYMVQHSVPKSRGPLGSHLFSNTARPFTIRSPKD